MKSPKCGNVLEESEGIYFCGACGAKFRKKAPAAEPTAARPALTDEAQIAPQP